MEISFHFVVGVIAGVLSAIAYLLYSMAILKGTTKPNRATWWILTLVGFLILTSYYAEGARTTIWVPLAYVIGPLIIAIFSLRYGEGSWTRFDQFCLAGAIISALVWFFTSSALLALLINIFIDFLGILPTIKKSYLRPESEDKTAWVLEAVASALNMFAISTWTFEIYVYPLYLVIANGTIAFLLVARRYKK